MTPAQFNSLPTHVQQFVRGVEDAEILPTKSSYLVSVQLNDVVELTKANMEHLAACPYFEKASVGVDAVILTFRRF